ncbi:MAG: hypothetical protein U1D68_14560 [Arthrobacter sp.]|nr:hypothetical protein [Arthrobacter sp.]MDZ4351484.1 hypothetical protein [Arthrobacter sp.]
MKKIRNCRTSLLVMFIRLFDVHHRTIHPAHAMGLENLAGDREAEVMGWQNVIGSGV